MTFVGCDFHTRQQHVAVLDTETGEVQACRLAHADQTVEHFYASLPRPVTVGIESTGYAQWFHALMQRQGHTLLVGDAARIRAMVVRKTKTDRRDAAHLLQLLSQDRFPAIWVPDPRVRDLRALEQGAPGSQPLVQRDGMQPVLHHGTHPDEPHAVGDSHAAVGRNCRRSRSRRTRPSDAMRAWLS